MALKSLTLKLSHLLSKYLFANNELTLTGIGKFKIENSSVEEEITEKNSKPGLPVIIFQQDLSAKEDDNLIAFISAQTGKMKSLATSDLESYLENAKQFMNIGKPFSIEGIGTLIKTNTRKYDFIPGESINEKIKENLTKETEQATDSDAILTEYSEIFSPKKIQTPVSKKIILFLAIIAGIAIAIWGGFIIYKKYSSPKTPPEITMVSQPMKDTTTLFADTTKANVTDSNTKAVYYKFIVEKAERLRAFERYNYLKKWGIDIKMETTDSLVYKLYFQLATLPTDTARVRDSLNSLYGTKAKTIIE